MCGAGCGAYPQLFGTDDCDRLLQSEGHVRQLVADLFTWHALQEGTLGGVLALRHAQVTAEAVRPLLVVNPHLTHGDSVRHTAIALSQHYFIIS